MPNNVGPGKLDKVGVTSGIAEHPAVVPELVALTEVVLDDPPLRFVVVLPCCPFVGEFPHLIVQRVEYLGRHHTPVIGGPPLDDRVEPGDDRRRIRSAQDAHLEREPLPEPPDGRLARFDQQLEAVAADVEPQEVESFLTEVHDLRLVLVEDETPGRQPFREPRLDLFGLLTGVAERDQVVGLCGPADYADRGVTVLVDGGDRGRVVGIIPAL